MGLHKHLRRLFKGRSQNKSRTRRDAGLGVAPVQPASGSEAEWDSDSDSESETPLLDAAESALDDVPAYDVSSEDDEEAWGFADPPPAYDDVCALGDIYRGEERRAEWREEGCGEYNPLGAIRTRYMDDGERAGARWDVDGDGRLVGAEGRRVDTSAAKPARSDGERGRMIYAMDPYGDLTGADQRGRDADLQGDHLDALRALKDFGGATFDDLPPRGQQRHAAGRDREYFHHSSFFAGADVAGAGEMEVDDGAIKRLTPNSGHYKPRTEHTHNTLTELQRRGANLDDTLVDLNELDGEGNTRPIGVSTVQFTRHAGEVLAAGGHHQPLQAKHAMLRQLVGLGVDRPLDALAAARAAPTKGYTTVDADDSSDSDGLDHRREAEDLGFFDFDDSSSDLDFDGDSWDLDLDGDSSSDVDLDDYGTADQGAYGAVDLHYGTADQGAHDTGGFDYDTNGFDCDTGGFDYDTVGFDYGTAGQDAYDTVDCDYGTAAQGAYDTVDFGYDAATLEGADYTGASACTSAPWKG